MRGREKAINWNLKFNNLHIELNAAYMLMFMRLIKYEMVMEMKKMTLKMEMEATTATATAVSSPHAVAFLTVIINPACNCHANHYITFEIAFVLSARISWLLYVLQPKSFAFAWIHLYICRFVSAATFFFSLVFISILSCSAGLLGGTWLQKNKTLSFYERYMSRVHAKTVSCNANAS